MIRVLDYGVGNVQAFLNVFQRLGLAAQRACCAQDLADASRLILPGVGAFDHAMTLLNASGMREALRAMVFERSVPLLGVCVGMQMLSEGSDEGALPGLGWVPGRVRAFVSAPEVSGLPLPHMGWNDLKVQPQAKLFQGFEPRPRFYFLHAYYFECGDRRDAVGTATYGFDFDCVVSRGHVHGVQCHPEKSHHFGAQLLKNFATL